MFERDVHEAIQSWKSWPVNLRQEPSIVKKIQGGLTNRSYLLATESQRYVLRIHNPKPESLGINRKIEFKILDLLAAEGIAPKLIYMCPNMQFCVFEYIDGRVWDQRDFRFHRQREKLLQLVLHFQKIELDIPPFDYLSHLDRYWNLFSKSQPSESKRVITQWLSFRRRLNLFNNLQNKRVLMHHDLVPGNIIETPYGLKIIDWEYAGLGYDGFDTTHIQMQAKRRAYLVDVPDKTLGVREELVRWLEYLWFRVS